MAQVQFFKEIDDFTRILDLNVEQKFDDFVIYKYADVKYEGYNKLSVYRHNFFEVAFELTEGCSLDVDQYKLPVIKNRLTLVSPHRLQHINLDSIQGNAENCEGFGLFFKPEFLNADAYNQIFLKDYPFFNHNNFPAVSISNNEEKQVVDLMNMMYTEYEKNEAFSKDIIKNYLNILFLKAKKYYINNPKPLSGKGRVIEIFQEFEYLVQNHFLDLTTVKDYADKLHVSPKHLSETVKQASGKNALEVIHNAQLNYAKFLLRYTSKTISEIAYELKFDYADYFSLFFKRKTGKSPLAFRETPLLELQ